MKRSLGTFLAVVFLVCTPAVAGVDKGNGEIGVDLGFTNFDQNVTDKNGVRLAVRGGYHFTKHFELEGQLGASFATQDVLVDSGISTLGTVTDSMDIDLDTIFVNGVFNFRPTPNIVPYFLAGIGSAHLSFETHLGSSIRDSGTAYQVAVGSRFFFPQSDHLAFRVELANMRETTFGVESTHTSLTVGCTRRLGYGR